MIRFSIIVCLVTMFNASLFAQHGTIHGIVLDRSSHKPLEYASVSNFRVVDSALSDGMVTGLSFAVNAQQTFTNPLLPSGADPWCIYKNGYYYYTNTTGRNITIWKTKDIAQLITAEKKVVFTPPVNTAYSKAVWAPEIHFLKKKWYSLKRKWYVYFAADSGNNKDHRMWVLQNSSRDPLKGSWKMKGKLHTPDDKWSIDGTVYNLKNKLYFLWSGWQGNVNGQQDIYIAGMKNPWTIKGERVRLSSPELEWETHGDLKNKNDVAHVDVNEGPQILRNKDQLYLIYSASGCWTDNYALGMLSTSFNSNILDSTSWKKSLLPVFKQSPENSVYGTGHNSFFKSPDGKEDWILYHANSQPGQGCGKFRSPRAQKFTWNSDGSPNFGVPVKENVPLAIPATGRNND
ncbi:MAG: glycoside hydrolase family 43 protein [Chitinophagaceae bacterium]